MSITIDNRVEEFRKHHKLSQEALAQRAGVSRQTINALERGNYFPSLLLALQIASVFSTTVDHLFTLRQTDDPPD